MMAKVVTLVDDLDETDGAKTINFSYKGITYKIDLAEHNEAAMDEAMQPWIEASTRARGGVQAKEPMKQPKAVKTSGRRKGKQLLPSDQVSQEDIRTWARENGHTVSDRGAIRRDVKEAFNVANEGVEFSHAE